MLYPVSTCITFLFVRQVSPQFDMRTQTPVEQWKKKPRRVKVSDIFKNPKTQATGIREKRPLRVVQNLKFHGEETRTSSCGCPGRVGTCLSQTGGVLTPKAKTQGCNSQIEKQVEFPAVEETFSSDIVFSDSQQGPMVDELSVFRPACASTPCAKKVLIQTAHTRPCNLYNMIPDPSPNVFRWCDDLFTSGTEKQNTVNPQSEDVDALQASMEKLSFQHSLPDDDERDEKNVTRDGSLSVLACNTPMHDGDYMMPYFRVDS